MVLATVLSKERQESTWWRDLHREVTLTCQSFIDPKRSFLEEKVFLDLLLFTKRSGDRPKRLPGFPCS